MLDQSVESYHSDGNFKLSRVNLTRPALHDQFPADLVTFTEDILNENFIFCAVQDLLGLNERY